MRRVASSSKVLAITLNASPSRASVIISPRARPSLRSLRRSRNIRNIVMKTSAERRPATSTYLDDRV